MRPSFHPFFLLLVLAAVVAVACGNGQQKTNDKPAVFTEDEWDLMQTADSVKLFRLAELNRYTPMAIPHVLYERIEFTFTDKDARLREFYYQNARLLTPKEREGLFPFVINQQEFHPINDYNKECYYRPGAGIKFYKGAERFYLLLCFNCNVWAFERNGAMYYVDFDSTQRAALVQYAKNLFPNDPAFQALKE